MRSGVWGVPVRLGLSVSAGRHGTIQGLGASTRDAALTSLRQVAVLMPSPLLMPSAIRGTPALRAHLLPGREGACSQGDWRVKSQEGAETPGLALGKVLSVSYGWLKRWLLLATPRQINSLLNKMSARNG